MSLSNNISVENKDFFDNFFRRYYQTLCYFAFSFLKEKDISEDIVQNIFVNLLNDSASFSSEEHLKHSLYKSIRNACINELKKNAMRSKALEDIVSKSEREDGVDIFDSIVKAEIYREIIEAINDLPEKCSEIFKLAYLDHLNNNEIAKKLSISINTVKVQKNNAKKQLREQLKHLYLITIILPHL